MANWLPEAVSPAGWGRAVAIPLDPRGACGHHFRRHQCTEIYTCACLQNVPRRLGRVQSDVLADTEPDPLQQLRGNVRHLRSLLKLFGSAFPLPKGVSEARGGNWLVAGAPPHRPRRRDLSQALARFGEN